MQYIRQNYTLIWNKQRLQSKSAISDSTPWSAVWKKIISFATSGDKYTVNRNKKAPN